MRQARAAWRQYTLRFAPKRLVAVPAGLALSRPCAYRLTLLGMFSIRFGIKSASRGAYSDLTG
jgi:hypothetical protein